MSRHPPRPGGRRRDQLRGRPLPSDRALLAVEPWSPPPAVADRLIEHLTLTSDRRGLEACVGRLQEFERLGLDEIALAPHGDPAAAIKLIGDAVIPTVDRDGASRVP